MSACSSGNIKRSLEKAVFLFLDCWRLNQLLLNGKKKTCRTGFVSFLRFFPGEWRRVLGKRRAMAGVWISRLGLASICLRLPCKRKKNKNTKIFYVFFPTFTTEALCLGRKRHCQSGYMSKIKISLSDPDQGLQHEPLNVHSPLAYNNT